MKPSFIVSLLILALGMRPAPAQNSLEMLQQDLDEMKAEHQEMTAKNFDAFITALQAAAQSPEAAEKLYLQAGGTLPKAADVRTEYEHETPREESARLAVDHNVEASFGGMLQLHCALMRYAAIFVAEPSTPGLNESWLAWLKTAAQAYPQIDVSTTDTRDDSTSDDDTARHNRRHRLGADSATGYVPAPPPDPVAPIKNLELKASPISSFLGFRQWKKSDQGTWSVADLPHFYQQQVLEPLRKAPTAETLAAWDVYMAMMNADQPDAKAWTEVDYPALLFDKDCDDFASAPDTDKLQTLIGIMKAHPDHPLQDEWLARMHAMVQGYRRQRSGSSVVPVSVAPETPFRPDATSDAPITATTVVPPATNSAPSKP